MNNRLRLILTFSVFVVFLMAFFELKGETDYGRGPYWKLIQSPTNMHIESLNYQANDGLYASVWGRGLLFVDEPKKIIAWEENNKGLSDLFVTSIVRDPITQKNFVSTFSGGIFWQTGQNSRWNSINDGLRDIEIKCLATSDEGDIVAGTYGHGVFILQPGETEWRQINGNLLHWDVNCLACPEDDIIIAGINGDGIYTSGDKGESWTNTLLDKIVTGITRKKDGKIYVSTLGEGVYSSIDNGFTWQSIGGAPLMNHCLSVASDNALLTGTNSKGIYRYKNNTWTNVKEAHNAVNAIASHDQDFVFGAFSFDGLFKSADGVTWYTDTLQFRVRDGLSPLAINNEGFITAANYYNQTGKVYYFDNIGEEWHLLFSGTSRCNSIAYDSLDYIYLGIDDGLYRSNTNNMGVIRKAFADTAVTSVATDKESNVLSAIDPAVYQGESGPAVFISEDNGETWSDIYSSDTKILFVAVAPGNDYYISVEGEGLLRSSDKGDTWNIVLGRDTLAYSIAFDKYPDAVEIFLGSDRGVLHSVDSAQTWDLHNYNSVNPQTRDIMITPDHKVYAVRSGDDMLLCSRDNGETWDSAAENLGVKSCRMESIEFSPDGYMFLATDVVYRTVYEPFLKAPSNLIADNSNLPLLRWNIVTLADMYQVQVSEDASFTNIIEDATAAPNLWEVFVKLQPQTTYYWRVRAKTNRSYGPWSGVDNFTTGLYGPNLSSPANNSGGLDSLVVFEWEKLSGDYSYSFEISDDKFFSGNVYSVSDIDVPSISTRDILPGERLKENTKYYWRVSAKDNATQQITRWSDSWNFTTKFGAIDLEKPLTGELDILDRIIFKWEQSALAERYQIQVAETPDFSVTFFDGFSNDNEEQVNDFDFSKQYYWRVKCFNSKNESYWSEVWNFKIFPGYPVKLFPKVDEEVFSNEITFNWDGHKIFEKYQLQVSKDISFTNEFIVYDNNVIPITEILVDDALEFCNTYFWRVKYIGHKTYPWSDTSAFRISYGETILINPEDKAKTGSVTVDFVWQEYNGAERYRLQISKDENNWDIPGLTANYEDLQDNYKKEVELDTMTTYFWRVQAGNDICSGPWSEIRSFTTAYSANVSDFGGDIELKVFPNPCKGKITFSFKNDNIRSLSLKLFNLYGEILDIPAIYDHGSSGIEIYFPRGTAPEGAYFYSLIINGRLYRGNILKLND